LLVENRYFSAPEAKFFIQQSTVINQQFFLPPSVILIKE